MNKLEVCVKLTRKNCKKVLGILEMFGEPVYHGDKDRWCNGIVFHEYTHAIYTESEGWKGFNNYQISSSYPDQKEVKPRELRNILAKEHLKEGDVIIVAGGKKKTEWVLKVKQVGENWGDSSWLSFKVKDPLDCIKIEEYDNLIGYNALSGDFLRFATDEEKALLEPKTTIITYTHEVWVNHYSDQEFHVHKKKSTADHLVHLNGNLGRRVQTVKATLTYDIPMTKV